MNQDKPETEEKRIEEQVIEQLAWDNRVDESGIHVEVRKDQVKLSGAAADYISRMAAVSDAMSVRGVRSVEDTISVRYPTSFPIPPDRDLKETIERIFRWNPEIGGSDIRADVDYGWVELSGAVSSCWKKLRAEQLASEIVGVLSLRNNLSVEPEVSVPDDQIAGHIRRTLERDLGAAARGVEVRVRDGRVTLTGSVPAPALVRRARRNAALTSGVRDIDNRLAVRKGERHG